MRLSMSLIYNYEESRWWESLSSDTLLQSFFVMFFDGRFKLTNFSLTVPKADSEVQDSGF